VAEGMEREGERAGDRREKGRNWWERVGQERRERGREGQHTQLQ